MSARRPSAPKLARAYVREMLAAGLKVGEFDVRVVGDEVTILTHPAAQALPSNDDANWVDLAGQTEIPRARWT